ncbi:uncharacterized protein METZ01_LOCUS269165 [marine metagenome]|jgi:membrane protein YdbS with pleckstrin-like domain|uniref:Uncharacterized protein n=1 Tax=marine metagenome TaxID=408172 RepID=A0A382K0X7_9ZZZZ|tara:strand:- start:209 stop:475 length:267 start_codon:yes stop_codon:yes gene_type:complete
MEEEVVEDDSVTLGTEEELPAKIEKWMEETPPVKRFTILSLLILFLTAFLIWYWDWANLSIDGMVAVLIVNTIVFFIIYPLIKKKNSS